MINKILLMAFDEVNLLSSFADNKEDTTSYDILLNVYDRENIV